MRGIGLHLTEFRLLANDEQVQLLDTGSPGIVVYGAQIMRMRVKTE